MKLIVGNQKTYLSQKEINDFVEFFKDKKFENVVIVPTYIYINSFRESCFALGSQDVSISVLENVTGEVTANQLKSLNVQYTLIGHSERRSGFQEGKDILIDKINNLLENDIVPILCIGESSEEREKNIQNEVIEGQISEIFSHLDNTSYDNVVIAYEPIWAIGSGKTPSNVEIEEMINYIKNIVKKDYKVDLKVLYGGSVSSKNISELNKIDIVDGYLIGKASTIKDEFLNIIESSQ